MRIIAIILNVVLIIVLLTIVTVEWPLRGEEILYFIIFFAAPIISVLALVISSGDRDNLASLYLKRKPLEEKEKINKLKGTDSK